MQKNKAAFHDQQLKGERVHSLLVSFRIHTDASKRFKPTRCAVKSFCVEAAVQITLIVLVAGLVTVAGGVAVGWMSKFLIPSIVNLARCLAVSPIGARTNPRKATSRTHREWGTNFRSQNILVNLSKIFWSQREIFSCRCAKFIKYCNFFMSTHSTFLSMKWQVAELMLAQDDTTSWFIEFRRFRGYLAQVL